jgi:hypothetical protein
VWLDWSTRLLTLLALSVILTGLVVLGLPDTMEGQEIVRLDTTHSVRVADLVGAGLVGVGTLLTWATVLTWQRRRIIER